MAIIGKDTMYRANQPGWGVASDGQAWGVPTGSDTYAIASNEGTITGSTSTSVLFLGAHKSVNFSLYCRMKRGSSSSTSTATGVCTRAANANTNYRAQLRVGLLEIVSVISNVATTLASAAYSVTLGSFDWLRFDIVGSQLYAKAWADDGSGDPSTSEPQAWTLGPITDTSVQGSGGFGIVTTLFSVSDVATYDLFSCDDLMLPAPGWLAPNPYGITIGLNNKQPPTPNYGYWSYLFNDMKTIGLTRVRFQVSFNLIWTTLQNPTNPLLDDPGLWAWAPLDDAVARCNAEGVPITFPIRQTPVWCHQNTAQQANTASPPFIQTDPALTAFIAQAVATRYNNITINPATGKPYGFIDCIELGNEDFNEEHTQPGLFGLYNSPYSEYNGLSGVPTGAKVEPARDPHFFVPVLQACAPLIRAASPRAKITLCAIWWRNWPNVADFLDDLYTEGGPAIKGMFDAVNLHFYSKGADPSTPGSGSFFAPSLAQALAFMYAKMVQYGDGAKKIRITEIGWSTNTNLGGSIDCDPTTQAQRFLATLETARLCGVVEEYDAFTLNYATQNRHSPPAAQTQSASIVQWDIPSQSYIKLSAYAMWQQYIATYVQFSSVPVTFTVQVPGPDGRVQAGGPDGHTTPALGPDGYAQASGPDGVVSAPGPDGFVLAAAGGR